MSWLNKILTITNSFQSPEIQLCQWPRTNKFHRLHIPYRLSSVLSMLTSLAFKVLLSSVFQYFFYSAPICPWWIYSALCCPWQSNVYHKIASLCLFCPLRFYFTPSLFMCLISTNMTSRFYVNPIFSLTGLRCIHLSMTY